MAMGGGTVKFDYGLLLPNWKHFAAFIIGAVLIAVPGYAISVLLGSGYLASIFTLLQVLGALVIFFVYRLLVKTYETLDGVKVGIAAGLFMALFSIAGVCIASITHMQASFGLLYVLNSLFSMISTTLMWSILLGGIFAIALAKDRKLAFVGGTVYLASAVCVQLLWTTFFAFAVTHGKQIELFVGVPADFVEALSLLSVSIYVAAFGVSVFSLYPWLARRIPGTSKAEKLATCTFLFALLAFALTLIFVLSDFMSGKGGYVEPGLNLGEVFLSVFYGLLELMALLYKNGSILWISALVAVPAMAIYGYISKKQK